MCTLEAEEDEEGERAQDGRERTRHLEHENPLLRAQYRYSTRLQCQLRRLGLGFMGWVLEWFARRGGGGAKWVTHPLDTVALQAVHDYALDLLPLAVRQAPALQLACTRIHSTRMAYPLDTTTCLSSHVSIPHT